VLYLVITGLFNGTVLFYLLASVVCCRRL